MEIINWEQDSFVHHRVVSAVKRVQFVSDRASHVVVRGRWCNILLMKVHARSEEKSDEWKDRCMRNRSRFLIIFLSNI